MAAEQTSEKKPVFAISQRRDEDGDGWEGHRVAMLRGLACVNNPTKEMREFVLHWYWDEDKSWAAQVPHQWNQRQRKENMEAADRHWQRV